VERREDESEGLATSHVLRFRRCAQVLLELLLETGDLR